MKKLTLGLAVLLAGFSANSLAGLPSGTSRCDVTVPSYCGGFTFGLTGLWWRATSPQQDFATSFSDFDLVTLDGIGDAHRHNHDHDYEWGFKANVGYVFPCSGNDVNLTYTHWDNDHRAHTGDNEFVLPTPGVIAALFDPFFGPQIPLVSGGVALNPILPLATILASDTFEFTDVTSRVAAKSEFENHTWDLDFGQAINVGCNFKVRWFGGLRYSHLENKLDTTFETSFTGTDPLLPVPGAALVDTTGTGLVFGGDGLIALATLDTTITDILHDHSKFNGIGPRFGFDLSYNFCGGFGLVGSLSAALLVGEVDSSFGERILTAGEFSGLGINIDGVSGITVTDGATIAATAFDPAAFDVLFADDTGLVSFHHPDETRVVPNIDAKLGVDWTYQFCNCSRSKLTIEAGYLVSHYFNAIDRLSAVEFTDPEFRTRQTIDTSFDGPYVSVQVAL